MTFWQLFVLLLIYVPLLLIWGTALFDVFRRDDLSGAATALWMVVIVLLPVVGTLVYLVRRPSAAPVPGRAVRGETSQTRVQLLTDLASLHDRGKLTDSEFAVEKQRLIRSVGTVPAQAPSTAR